MGFSFLMKNKSKTNYFYCVQARFSQDMTRLWLQVLQYKFSKRFILITHCYHLCFEFYSGFVHLMSHLALMRKISKLTFPIFIWNIVLIANWLVNKHCKWTLVWNKGCNIIKNIVIKVSKKGSEVKISLLHNWLK